MKVPVIFVIAGEQSGDLIGGKLLAAINDLTRGKIKFAGVGGQNMQAQGLESLFPMSDLSVMGIFEVISHLPRILSRLNLVKSTIAELKPDVVVTIDAPDFSLRLSHPIRSFNIPHVHYIAPTVWAWRPGRARKIASKINHLLAIYPFEPPYFEKHKLPCTFVGHMISELGIEDIAREEFRQLHNIAADAKLVCWLPGSRISEVKALLPIHIPALLKLQQQHPTLVVALPMAPGVAQYVQSQIGDLPFRIIPITADHERYQAMRAADVALAASGTVNLELARAQTPFIITYKINPITAWLAKRILKVKYVTMVNILCDSPIVPEFLQEKCTPANIFNCINAILSDKAIGEKQLKGLRKANQLLQTKVDKPSYMAAKIVLDYLKVIKG